MRLNHQQPKKIATVVFNKLQEQAKDQWSEAEEELEETVEE